MHMQQCAGLRMPKITYKVSPYLFKINFNLSCITHPGHIVCRVGDVFTLTISSL